MSLWMLEVTVVLSAVIKAHDVITIQIIHDMEEGCHKLITDSLRLITYQYNSILSDMTYTHNI